MRDDISQALLGNRFLRELPYALFERVRPFLMIRELIEINDLSGLTVFPITAEVALASQATGEHLVSAGEDEGVLAAWFFDEITATRLAVRLRGAAVVAITAALGELQPLLASYVSEARARALRWQLMVSHASLNERVARYLLTFGRDELILTQEQVGAALTHRREGVTAAFQTLLKARLVDHSRGRVTIHDRSNLQAYADELSIISSCKSRNHKWSINHGNT